nr:hypothetical protein [uncultured bacterium]
MAYFWQNSRGDHTARTYRDNGSKSTIKEKKIVRSSFFLRFRESVYTTLNNHSL